MQARYRREDGEPCIDIKVATIDHLFDRRDPAPFRDRDLDDDLSEYLLDASEDLHKEPRIRVVFWLEAHCASDEISTAYHAHFQFVLERLARTRKRTRRFGQVAMMIAIAILVASFSLSRVVTQFVGGSLGEGLKEGLVIFSWVVMWRPVELLIFDWIPVRRERAVIRRLVDARVDVRFPSDPA